jgi:catechol 2,3-dioxygenase-like lactoylglutathione lyase family enzyme
MVDIQGVAHFTIPVSDMERSKRFYSDIVGLKHLATLPSGTMAFFDAGGTCIILVKRNAPINRHEEGSDGVHHAFMIGENAYAAALDHVRAKGVDIFFEEDRQGGVVNGPRAYFRDPDGTCLEYIVLTSYSGAKPKTPS